jgi:hypothetical protein
MMMIMIIKSKETMQGSEYDGLKKLKVVREKTEQFPFKQSKRLFN